MNSQPHAPASLPPGKELPYLFNSRLGGPQRLSGRFGEKKNLLPLPGFEPRILVNVVTTVSQPLTMMMTMVIIIIIIIIIIIKGCNPASKRRKDRLMIPKAIYEY